MRDRRFGSRGFAAFWLIVLTGCSTFAPYEAVSPGDNQYSVCYNRLGGSAEQVRHIAGLECTGATEPRLVRQEFNINACPILTPMQAVFSCAAPAAHPAP